MAEVLEKRRQGTNERLAALRQRLKAAGDICGDSASVYVTGSFARGEASDHSDLDLFILAQEQTENVAHSPLTKLDEIRLKAALIDATRAEGIPDFSGDGAYLVSYTPRQIAGNIGTDHDDSDNTFTARLLLLLESKPLVGEERLYSQAIDEGLNVYWKDFADHKDSFMPAFLANDILRYWRTLCVNYEARTKREPAEKKAKRKLKNYKLKHSRMLTCYSALLYLLRVHSQRGTVTPDDARKMIASTPTERLQDLATEPEIVSRVYRLVELYEAFLAETDAPEPELISRFKHRVRSRELYERAREFGDAMAKLLEVVGTRSTLHRLLLV